MSDELVLMKKGDATLSVHPNAVKAHEAVGWKKVEAAEKAVEASAEEVAEETAEETGEEVPAEEVAEEGQPKKKRR